MSDTPAPAPTPTEPAFFDLAACDILTPSEEGRPLLLVHPSGATWKTSTGAPVQVTLRGRYSSVARDTLKRLGDEIAAMAADGKKPTPEDQDRHDTEYLVACTVNWNIERLDGAVFHVTPANIERLWTDKRFAWLRMRALSHIAADVVFLTPPA